MPVVKVKLAIEEIERGQLLQLVATDPGSKSDMACWAESTGNTILEAKEEGGFFTYLVRKS
jgi:TusA-related sulfurtransferase